MFKYNKILLSIFFYIISVFIYNYYSYINYKQNEIAIIDDKLKIAAYAVYTILGKDFFEIAVNENSISLEEDWENINKLSFYNKHANLAFIYSSIKIDNKIYLTSSSASAEELKNKSELHYFHHYNDAGEGLVKSFESQEIIYENHTDKWGTFRAVHIPITLENSNVVVISSEISMEAFIGILDNTKNKYFWEMLFYLLLTIPIIITIYFFVKEKILQNMKMQEKLLFSDKLASSLFEVAPILINAIDKNGKFIIWNEECEKVFGWSIEELDKSSSPLELFYPEVEMQKKVLDTILNEPEKVFRQWHPINKKGKKLVTMWTHIYLPNGETINIGYDITQSLENEKLLLNQSKMAAMGEMLSTIAHQWRQPLSVISTAATGTKLQNEINVLTDKDIIQNMDTINNSAQYLSQIIEDFRAFFNPNNNIEKFKISDAIDESLKFVSPQFTTKNIEIIKNIEEFEMKAVKNELIQVLIIILNNAKGIPKDIINRVFEPYFTTKHQSQGTGIGLYMSEEIVKKHLEGSFTVTNETYFYEGIEYTGANFVINVPID